LNRSYRAWGDRSRALGRAVGKQNLRWMKQKTQPCFVYQLESPSGDRAISVDRD